MSDERNKHKTLDGVELNIKALLMVVTTLEQEQCPACALRLLMEATVMTAVGLALGDTEERMREMSRIVANSIGQDITSRLREAAEDPNVQRMLREMTASEGCDGSLH